MFILASLLSFLGGNLYLFCARPQRLSWIQSEDIHHQRLSGDVHEVLLNENNSMNCDDDIIYDRCIDGLSSRSFRNSHDESI